MQPNIPELHPIKEYKTNFVMCIQTMTKNYRIHIKGLVQGVGFRPFVYRLAHEMNLKGWVENSNDGVFIEINGSESITNSLSERIQNEKPAASYINSISIVETDFTQYNKFEIKNRSDAITDISPDIAVCDACLEDLKKQKHRIDYPFINCTNCGPRFTIIKDLPYDREKTTMDVFPMCAQCKKEYTNILNRRFHAQPVACNNCGPEYTMHTTSENYHNIQEILNRTASLIDLGKTVTIKGLGGFFLACDATSNEAVDNLRRIKQRDGKPLAVMFKDINTIHQYAIISEGEEATLRSWRRPVVLVGLKKQLADNVCIGLNSVGAFLPYMPFHYLLFEKLKTHAIVLTSGNISGKPIITEDKEAIDELGSITDAIVSYNRDIYNRTDDSVSKFIANKERIFRRSRGYAPAPVNLQFQVDGIVATGAELVNCFCVGKGNQAFMSQHIGDLKNLETFEFYKESFNRYCKLFRISPKYIACDLHPDYLSSRFANELNIPVVQVQHHHAHIASCMTEHMLDEEVIGISMDGTGLGEDGNIWGSEFLFCDLESFTRFSHFKYLPLPGGDKAAEQTWRMGVSLLHSVYGRDFLDMDIPFNDKIKSHPIELILQAIEKNINCPLSSGAGRYFDAVAAILNINHKNTFPAEGPIRLESVLDQTVNDQYTYDITEFIDLSKMVQGIVKDIKLSISIPIIAAKFHNTIISVIFTMVLKMSERKNIRKVVFSGGTFQNKYMTEKLEEKLMQVGYSVYFHEKVPSNDGGIALGQLAIAAKKINKKS